MLGLAAPVGEPAIAQERRALLEELAARLERVRSPAGAEVALVDAALSLVSDQVVAGEPETLPGLLPGLRELLATPVDK